MTKAIESPDPDVEKVLEVLRAATRGPRDPDIGLARMLSELVSPGNDLDAQALLKRLVGDVGSD